MVLDTTVILRKTLTIAPRWTRYALLGSFVVGACLESLSKIFAPALLTHTGWVNITNLASYDWVLIGLVVTMPISFLWHTLGRLVRGPTPYEQAEQYIAILKMGVSNAHMTQASERMFWNSALGKLAQEFSVGARPPAPSTIITDLDTPASL
jgi:hypothetical protein